MKMSPEERKAWERKLPEFNLVLGTSKEASAAIYSKLFAIPIAQILCVDPETINDDQVIEPEGDSPIQAVLFKLRRTGGYTSVKYRDKEATYHRKIAELLKEDPDCHHQIRSSIYSINKSTVPKKFKGVRRAFRKMMKAGENGSLIREKLVFSSDVLAQRNGQLSHRPWRDQTQDLTEKEERRLAAQVLREYRHAGQNSWDVSFGFTFERELRVLEDLCIEGDFPRVDRKLAKGNLELRSSTGIKLVELARELNVSLTIRRKEGTEKFPISPEQAERLIVLKAPLHQDMLEHLMTERSVQALEKPGQLVPYHTIPVSDKTLGDWLAQPLGAVKDLIQVA